MPFGFEIAIEIVFSVRLPGLLDYGIDSGIGLAAASALPRQECELPRIAHTDLSVPNYRPGLLPWVMTCLLKSG